MRFYSRCSSVTPQPTVKLGIHLPVARDAESHLEIDPPQPVGAAHVAVAGRTVEARPRYVGLVTKEDKLRDPEHADPRDRLLCVEIAFCLLISG